MNRVPRSLVMLGIVIIAALMAFPLRDTIYETVVVPLAFVTWELGLLYHSLSQAIWWWLVVGLVVFMLVSSLLSYLQPRRKEKERSRLKRGPVEDLAIWMGRAQGGVYFKWLIANRLGKLAYQMLLHRESGRPRSVFAPLIGADWQPSKELQNYLEIGMHGSLSEFSAPNCFFSAQPKTPMDYEIIHAIEFLEMQVESDHQPRSHPGMDE